jgi:hypothetical protein
MADRGFPAGPAQTLDDLAYFVPYSNGEKGEAAVLLEKPHNRRVRGDGKMMTLEEARTDVDGWLNEVKLRTGKCSELIRNEIAEGMRQRTINAFAVYDEIGQMEQSEPPRPTGTKPAKPLKGELSGLMHKHYKTASLRDFIRNIENHWKQPDSRAERERIESEVRQGGHIGKAAHEIVLDGYQARHGADKMTGEWIVYAVVGGVNYYLTLATHEEGDSAVRERVRSCFAEFPELQAAFGGIP